MPYQNRVDPFGALIFSPARGTLMGNRGILHDADRQIRRGHAHQSWITCALSFKGRTRKIMEPGRYTELFFLDEATSFAAGHRPCAECRRQRYVEVTTLWCQCHGVPPAGQPLAKSLDRALHARRITRDGKKITHEHPITDLPDGTMVDGGGCAVLLWQGRQLDWTAEGYLPRLSALSGSVRVLTPEPVVALFRAGLTPEVHDSAA